MAAASPPSWGGELPPPLKTAKAGKLATILVDPNGMTLYIYAPDTQPGKSACIGGCAQNWPPIRPGAYDPAPKAALSVITRDDGSKQYAYKRKSLYFWVRDRKPGDTTGHQLGGVWFVAQP
ncbi:MAG: hypothetical protein ACE5JN_09550 [Candidatus Methylomirabilia bacterium]